ncbi:MAG: hypothetical protein ACLPIX_17610 [Rhodomicrobium sp.]
MPDNNVESHTLVVLREIREAVRGNTEEIRELREAVRGNSREIREMREQTNLIPQIKSEIAELQIAVAAVSTDMKIVKKDVEDLKETSSLIEGRLVRFEKQTGCVKA